MDAADLINRFTYHAPQDHEQAEKYALVRAQALTYAQIIDRVAPDSREKSLAITHLEQAVMWANAAIARNG